MIIFGTRRTVLQLAVVLLTCAQGHPAAHTVSKLVTKFTLFFVPLFPIRTRYVVQCTLCAASGQVDREHAERLVASAAQQQDQHQPAPPQQPWSPDGPRRTG